MQKRYLTKIFLAFMLVLFILIPATTTSAYTPNPSRWTWIDSNDKVGIFVSTDLPTRYEDGVKQWVMHVLAEGGYSLYLEGFRAKDGKESCFIQYANYDDESTVISSGKIPYVEWETVIPGTMGEEVWNYVVIQLADSVNYGK